MTGEKPVQFEVIAKGLRFPEGPIWMPNGDLILVEIEAGRLSRVSNEGVITTIADLGGSPNGAAIGPDGACYVCNSDIRQNKYTEKKYTFDYNYFLI
mgnify:CR=1 FL=1